MNRNRVYRASWILALAAVGLLGLSASVHATTFYWDTNQSEDGNGSDDQQNLGPNGTWGPGNYNWNSDPSYGAGYQTDSPTINDDLVFGQTATYGASFTSVTVSGTQYARAIAFSDTTGTGYTLTGGTVTLGGAGSISLTGAGIKIGSAIDGTAGLNKTGSPLLTLSGANTYTGGTSIGGALKLDFSNAAAPASNIINSGALTLNSGFLSITGSASTANSQTFGDLTANGNSTITLTSNGNPLTLHLGNINRGPNAFLVLTMPASGGATTTQPNSARRHSRLVAHAGQRRMGGQRRFGQYRRLHGLHEPRRHQAAPSSTTRTAISASTRRGRAATSHWGRPPCT